MSGTAVMNNLAAGAGVGTFWDAPMAYAGAAIFSILYLFTVGWGIAFIPGHEALGAYLVLLSALAVGWIFVVFLAELFYRHEIKHIKGIGVGILLVALFAGFIWSFVAILIGRHKIHQLKKSVAKTSEQNHQRDDECRAIDNTPMTPRRDLTAAMMGQVFPTFTGPRAHHIIKKHKRKQELLKQQQGNKSTAS